MEENVVETYKDAKAIAESSYWVEKIEFADTRKGDQAQDNFYKYWEITDRSTNGLVHYSKKVS